MKRMFGERLKELRLEKNLSFEKLSKATGLPKSSLCNWENCKTDITSDYLIVLADFFGVSTDFLLGRED